MCKHEEKNCPRCNRVFECKPGNITECQCFGILFNETEKRMMAEEYADCLCHHCLMEMKNEFTVQAKQLPLQKNEH